MDGIPAPDLWNLVMEVFHCNQNQFIETKDSSSQGNLWHLVMSSTRKKNQAKAPTKHDNSELFHIDDVPSTVKFSQSTAMLYVFERSRDQNDSLGQESNNETCVKDPQGVS